MINDDSVVNNAQCTNQIIDQALNLTNQFIDSDAVCLTQNELLQALNTLVTTQFIIDNQPQQKRIESMVDTVINKCITFALTLTTNNDSSNTTTNNNPTTTSVSESEEQAQKINDILNNLLAGVEKRNRRRRMRRRRLSSNNDDSNFDLDCDSLDGELTSFSILQTNPSN